MYVTDTIYNDEDPDQLETLPPTKIHRNTELEMIEAEREGIQFTVLYLDSLPMNSRICENIHNLPVYDIFDWQRTSL